MIKHFTFFILLFGFQFLLAQSPSVCFSAVNASVASSNQQSGVASADFNNDGNLDLVFANFNNGIYSYAFGNGAGGFSAPISQTISGTNYKVKAADFNNDGNADIVFTADFPQRVILMLGSGLGTFSAPLSFTTTPPGIGFVSDLIVNDFNSDGNIDVATANIYDPSVSVMLGTGTGSFQTPYVFSVGTATNSHAERLCSGDFNNDGIPDIAVSDYFTNSFSILQGIGTGSFNAAVVYTLSSGSIGICTEDLNKDGNMDLAITTTNNDLELFIGLGNGSFTAGATYTIGTLPYSIISSDINKDGNPDLITGNYGLNNMSVLLGLGNGTFVSSGTYSTGSYPYDIITADFNNDGLKDVALANSNDNFASVYINGLPNLTVTATPSAVCSGNSSTLLAGGANTYTWSGGPNTANYVVSPTVTTSYTVNATKAATGCTSTAVRTISISTPPSLTITASGTVFCSGSSATLNASGASSYTWSGGPTTASYLVSPAATTNYTLTGTAANGCTNSVAQTISVNPLPSLTITTSNTVICTGHTATLTGSGASTYTWSGGPSTAAYVVSPLSNTNYTLTGTSSNGCTNTAVQSVSVNTLAFLSINSTGQNICSGQTTTMTGLGAASYSWVSGPNTNTYAVTPTVTTSYTLFATSAVGCTNSMVVPITVSTSPVLTITASNSLICSGISSTLTGSGASTYTWSAGPNTAVYNVNPGSTTNYTLTGTAANGCTDTAVQQVSVNASPILTISPSSTVICTGQTATLTGSGANTYTWAGGGPSTAAYTLSPVTTTNYTLNGTAANGCTDTAVQQVSVNTTPVLTIAPSSTIICSGASATLTGSGASTYTWIGGPSTAVYVVNPLTNTNYTLLATAANACTNSAVRSLSVNTSPVLTITPSSTVICSGKTATLTGSGANTYTWVTGPSTAAFTINPIVSSNYTLNGTIANGCTATAVQALSVNTTPVLTISPSSTLICTGQTATLTGSGASTYTWSGGPTNSTYTVNPLVNSNYTLTATAANSCTNFAIQSLSVNTSPNVIINSSSSDICAGNSATLTGSGANTYTWAGGPNTDTFIVSPLISSDYTVFGTAVNGCTASSLYNILVNFPPTLTITPSNTLICSGISSTLTGSGASTYTWISGPSNAVFVVNPGTTTQFTLFGTAANTCTNIAFQTVSVLATPVLTFASSSTVICSGNSATLNANGANTYTWNSGPNTSTYIVNPILTSSYTLDATALNGCTTSAVQILSVNATPTLNIAPSNTLFCLGKTLTLTASGASTFTWSGGPAASAYTVSPLLNSNYTVTGTAPGNCTNSSTYSVEVNTPPSPSIAASSTVICSGKNTTLTASGANTYTWAAGPATTVYVASPMLSNTFTVVGTAVNGCTNFAIQSISVNASPNITITPSNSLVCSWTTATLTGSGANTYTWTGGPTSQVFTISPFSSTNYTLTGTAVNGCTNDAVQSISITPSPTLNITPTSSLICSGNSSTLTANGAATYTWTGGPVNSIYIVSPATTTTYILYGTAANSCTGSVVKTISVNATPGLTIYPSSTVICQGSIATLTAQGAATFTWSGGPSVSVNTVSPVSNANYTVIGETNGCTNSAIQSISVNVSPTLVISPGNPSICSGNSITLNASGAVSYTWAGGPNTSSFTVNPGTTTEYTLSGTTAAGGNCSSSVLMTVTVNITPTLSVNSGSICSGNSFVILPSGASVYTISGGSATVSPMANTNYTINGISAEGCPALNPAISHVTVSTTPSISVNSGSICTGNSFSIVPIGADTYTISGGFSVVSPSINSSYSVSGSSSLGCVANNIAISDVTVYITPTVTANNGTICSGDSFTINASGAASYSFSSGLGIVNPTANTNYSITGFSAEGCVSGNTATISVSVNASPTITVNSGNLCYGEIFTIFPGGALTYSISGGSNTVNPISNTNYTVTGTNALGCVSNSPAISTVVVLPNPTVTVNSGSVCPGFAISLQATGANSYSWNTGASQSSISVTPTISNTYTVIGTASNNCTGIAISSISVPPPVNASITPSSIFFCFGNSLTLTASGAPNYTWSNASQNSSIVVSPSVSTSYSLIASTGVGGCSNTAAYVVTVNPSPTVSISGNSLSCAGYQNTLSASGALSYTWNNGTMAQFIVVNPTITTNYNVVGVNFQGCTDTAYYLLNTTSMHTPSLCLVTVDSLSQFNEIYWDKSFYPEADTFIVYRESSASIYTPIAHIPKNAFSAYVDTNRSIGPITGDPNISLHRYKLQYIDTCGNMSPLSAYHESVKITDNLTGNFNWNYYAIEGVGPLQTLNYVLTRRNIVSGITFTVGVAAGNQLSDPQYATLSATGNMKWFVFADGFSCNPSLKTSETSAVKSRTKSNNTNEKQFPTGIETEYELLNQLLIFPNPANEFLSIVSSGVLKRVKLTFMDISGRQLYQDEINGSKYQLDTREINNGVYILLVSPEGKSGISYKVIIQH